MRFGKQPWLMTRISFLQKWNSVNHPLFGVMFLILFGALYSFSALVSPFWVGNDAWSNLLPIIHYRDSILNDRSLPLYTDLWYGGRAQWENPLWSFLYPPATVVYLFTPLDWGTRIVYAGHLLFILFSGRRLASLFSDFELEKTAAAILFASPVLPAFTAGQSEKIMSWGWVLLGVYFLLSLRRSEWETGLWAGLCLGIIPLTGSNYYAFYAGILFSFLLIGRGKWKTAAFFALGASIGLLHLPSVLYLAGESRGNVAQSIQEFRLSIAGVVTSLSIGLAKPMGWETWAPVGVPVVYLFFKKIYLKFKHAGAWMPLERSLMISLLIFVLLGTGLAYTGHHLLDTFRVPMRAVSFIALVVLLVVIVRPPQAQGQRNSLLILSAVQVAVLSMMIRPDGALYSPYDAQAQHLADLLKQSGAKSVWISMRELNDMYIQAVLNQNGLSLPNVYYGDMGQEVKITGDYCGYSFDHLVVPAPAVKDSIELKADMEWSDERGEISIRSLEQVGRTAVNGIDYQVFRVRCDFNDTGQIP